MNERKLQNRKNECFFPVFQSPTTIYNLIEKIHKKMWKKREKTITLNFKRINIQLLKISHAYIAPIYVICKMCIYDQIQYTRIRIHT